MFGNWPWTVQETKLARNSSLGEDTDIIFFSLGWEDCNKKKILDLQLKAAG